MEYTKFDGLDAAIIGVSTRDGSQSVLVYSVDKIVEILTGWLASQTDIFSEDWQILV